MSRLTRTLLAALLILGLAACTTRNLYAPSQALPPGREYSQVELQHAIVSALEARQWEVRQVSQNQVLAQITVRGRHHAEIAIDYSPAEFQIRYLSSSGLDYEDGKIHRNYNRWIKKLRNDILQQLHTNSG